LPGPFRGRDHRRADARIGGETRRRGRLVERSEHADVEPLRLDAGGGGPGAEALRERIGLELGDVLGLLDPA
jgi:hypothetical protein